MAENYVENFSFGEDEDEKTFQVKDPEAIEAEGGELANAIVTYDNEETTVQSFTDFISNFVSGTKIAKWFKDFKAGVEYILHVGSLVNNCVTDNAELPLSAAQGKVLMDELTSVKSDLTELDNDTTARLPSNVKILTGTIAGGGATLSITATSMLFIGFLNPSKFMFGCRSEGIITYFNDNENYCSPTQNGTTFTFNNGTGGTQMHYFAIIRG